METMDEPANPNENPLATGGRPARDRPSRETLERVRKRDPRALSELCASPSAHKERRRSEMNSGVRSRPEMLRRG